MISKILLDKKDIYGGLSESALQRIRAKFSTKEK